MSVQIHIPQFLQHLTGDEKVAEVGGRTVSECLDALLGLFPRLETHILDKNGELYGYLEIFINRVSAYPNELAKTVAEGDELHIVNIIVGG